jgi:hypothetical protein
MKRLLFALLGLTASLCVFAQDSAVARLDREATGLRADGKIYVVIVVLLTILAGLFFYIIRLDKKISRFEKNS